MNDILLVIVAASTAICAIILIYWFETQSPFERKQERTQRHADTFDDFFRTEVMYTGVTLGSICELCPKTIFRVKDNCGGYFVLDTEKVDEKKLHFYKTIFVKALNATNYELEVSDPSLL